MEQPVKIIVSSKALFDIIGRLSLHTDVVEISVCGRTLYIGDEILHVEHNKQGMIQVSMEKLRYLRHILRNVEDSPVVLMINGDNLFLSEIYI